MSDDTITSTYQPGDRVRTRRDIIPIIRSGTVENVRPSLSKPGEHMVDVHGDAYRAGDLMPYFAAELEPIHDAAV